MSRLPRRPVRRRQIACDQREARPCSRRASPAGGPRRPAAARRTPATWRQISRQAATAPISSCRCGEMTVPVSPSARLSAAATSRRSGRTSTKKCQPNAVSAIARAIPAIVMAARQRVLGGRSRAATGHSVDNGPAQTADVRRGCQRCRGDEPGSGHRGAGLAHDGGDCGRALRLVDQRFERPVTLGVQDDPQFRVDHAAPAGYPIEHAGEMGDVELADDHCALFAPRA